MKTKNLIMAITVLVTFCLALISHSCTSPDQGGASIKKESFGEIDGKDVFLYTLTNKDGNVVKLTNYGAKVVWISVPDRNVDKENITFGYETLEGYLSGDPYFGSVVGRYANRIAKGKFILDGVEYNLTLNNGPNTLHGGPGGWHSVIWDAEEITREGIPGVRFKYHSPDGEEGYPGNVNAEVEYAWSNDNELGIYYKVTSDKTTVLNITNHAYFNLHGAGEGDILDHELMIAGSAFTPVDSTLIPTGEIRPVEGTPMDFRKPLTVGERIDDDYEQLVLGRGYDHNYVLDSPGDDTPDASVYDPSSGRLLEMFTDQPGMQFYCGNFLDGTQTGHGGKKYIHRGGLCLETQHFPDSPNQPAFPSVILEPGKPFTSYTKYRFLVK